MAGLTCERAAVVLRGLEKNELVVEADEIEELIALGLAVEADPDDLSLLSWLQPVVREFARTEIDNPSAIPTLEARIKEVDDQLKNDWYRMTTGKAERQMREEDRVTMRRAVALLRDRTMIQTLSKITTNSTLLAPNTKYVVCAALGSELYALTVKGYRVRRSLKVRLERFGSSPVKAFLASFDKTEAKMRVFSGEIGTLNRNIGFVKKNREQVVIGLAKTGVPAGHALGAYHEAVRGAAPPDVAVTCARNAQQFGGAGYAAQRLKYAQNALVRAGFPSTPIAIGTAKTLLAFDPPDAGIPRYVEFMKRLEQIFGRSEMLYKYTARLMPATGSPTEVVARVVAVGSLLQQLPPRVRGTNDARSTSVAIAGMVKSPDALRDVVVRFRELEEHLIKGSVSTEQTVEGDALECIACPGTPMEVVDTVAILMEQLGQQAGGQHRGNVAIAVSFAKRFAF